MTFGKSSLTGRCQFRSLLGKLSSNVSNVLDIKKRNLMGLSPLRDEEECVVLKLNIDSKQQPATMFLQNKDGYLCS